VIDGGEKVLVVVLVQVSSGLMTRQAMRPFLGGVVDTPKATLQALETIEATLAYAV
jgi:hypothetical protein